MATVTASEARRQLYGLIEQANQDHSSIRITSRRGNAVLMSEEDYESWVETMHLLRSPRNARRLLESIEQAERGDLHEVDLLE